METILDIYLYGVYINVGLMTYLLGWKIKRDISLGEKSQTFLMYIVALLSLFLPLGITFLAALSESKTLDKLED